MKYVEYINQLIKKQVLDQDKILLFGQNISAGSCLSGLTRGLAVKPGGRIINTPNSENVLCGIGFGSMMNGVSAVFFMKQLDFLLLGIDHLVNTYNVIRRKSPKASFTIMPIIVDGGYAGPQSSFNNLTDLCALAQVPGYTMTNMRDAKEVIGAHFISPGFRIIAVSEQSFKKEIIDPKLLYVDDERTLFQYSDGTDATIVCFNLSYRYGHEFAQNFSVKGARISLFSVNSSLPISWEKILFNLGKTRKLIIIDDSKSANPPWKILLEMARLQGIVEKARVFQRLPIGYPFRPQHDQLEIEYEKIVSEFLS